MEGEGDDGKSKKRKEDVSAIPTRFRSVSYCPTVRLTKTEAFGIGTEIQSTWLQFSMYALLMHFLCLKYFRNSVTLCTINLWLEVNEINDWKAARPFLNHLAPCYLKFAATFVSLAL